jgi:thiamine biosynthesis lipoprotein ApbE
MAIYIQLSVLRINCNHHTARCLALGLIVAGCGAESPPAVARVWPVMGTMMSAAAWAGAADTARLAGALHASRDSVDRIDSLLQHRAHFAALDSVQRDVWNRTAVKMPAESLAAGYALDRAALPLALIADSALLDLGGQYLWIGRAGRVTHRIVGIPDPDNSLQVLGTVELRSGSVRTQSQTPERHGRARSVTVLAPDALTARAWSLAFFAVGCDSAFAVAGAGAFGGRLSVVCEDSAGVRWTDDLKKRVIVPESLLARPPRASAP